MLPGDPDKSYDWLLAQLEAMIERQRLERHTKAMADGLAKVGGAMPAVDGDVDGAEAATLKRTCRIKWWRPPNNETIVADVVLFYRGSCSGTGAPCSSTVHGGQTATCTTGVELAIEIPVKTVSVAGELASHDGDVNPGCLGQRSGALDDLVWACSIDFAKVTAQAGGFHCGS